MYQLNYPELGPERPRYPFIEDAISAAADYLIGVEPHPNDIILWNGGEAIRFHEIEERVNEIRGCFQESFEIRLEERDRFKSNIAGPQEAAKTVVKWAAREFDVDNSDEFEQLIVDVQDFFGTSSSRKAMIAEEGNDGFFSIIFGNLVFEIKREVI